MVVVCLVLQQAAKLLSRVVIPFYIPTNNVRMILIYAPFSQLLVLTLFSDFSHSGRGAGILHCSFNLNASNALSYFQTEPTLYFYWQLIGWNIPGNWHQQTNENNNVFPRASLKALPS